MVDSGGGENERYIFRGQPFGCPSEPNGGDNEKRTSDPGQRQGRRQKTVLPSNGPLTIKQLLYEFPTCPPSAYMHVKEFFNNDNMNNTLTNCKYAEKDVRNWCARLNS